MFIYSKNFFFIPKKWYSYK